MTTELRPGTTHYATPNDTDVVITRVVAAPQALVFAAYTQPEHIRQWMTGPDGWTMPVCEFEPRAGTAWRMVFRREEGTEMTLSGTVVEVDPPHRVVTTENWGPEWPDTRNTTEFSEANGHTVITLTIRYASQAVRDAALETGMKQGLEASFARLDRVAAAMQV